MNDISRATLDRLSSELAERNRVREADIAALRERAAAAVPARVEAETRMENIGRMYRTASGPERLAYVAELRGLLDTIETSLLLDKEVASIN